MSFPETLRHFAQAEFKHPDLMDHEFLFWLDKVRHRAEIGFFVTSDARTAEENVAVGGSAKSLHLLGRAIDFSLNPWTAGNLWKVNRAIVLSEFDSPRKCAIEWEIVDNPGVDQHLHLGLYPDQRMHKLIVKPT